MKDTNQIETINITYVLPKLMQVLNLDKEELKNILNVDDKTIANYFLNKSPNKTSFDRIIKLIEENGLDIFSLLELYDNGNYLFHASKKGIIGQIDTNYNKERFLDFGNGFYLSESLEIAIDYVCAEEEPIIYIFNKSDFIGMNEYAFKDDLKGSLDWVLFIGLNRNKIQNLKQKAKLKNYFNRKFKKYDALVGKIADSSMFVILENFFSNLLSLGETKANLLKAKLGNQYVIKNQEKAKNLNWIKEYKIEKKLLDYIKMIHINKTLSLKASAKEIEKFDSYNISFEDALSMLGDNYE